MGVFNLFKVMFFFFFFCFGFGPHFNAGRTAMTVTVTIIVEGYMVMILLYSSTYRVTGTTTLQ